MNRGVSHGGDSKSNNAWHVTEIFYELFTVFWRIKGEVHESKNAFILWKNNVAKPSIVSTRQIQFCAVNRTRSQKEHGCWKDDLIIHTHGVHRPTHYLHKSMAGSFWVIGEFTGSTLVGHSTGHRLKVLPWCKITQRHSRPTFEHGLSSLFEYIVFKQVNNLRPELGFLKMCIDIDDQVVCVVLLCEPGRV